MNRNISNNIPRKLIPIFNEKPEYFFPEYRIKFEEEIINSTIHIRINETDNRKIDKISTQIIECLNDYTPNIEIEKKEILGNLISVFKMDIEDLADLSVSCAQELKKYVNIFVGAHLGRMKAIRNPNGFAFPIFEGFQLKVGMIMADLAEKMEKSVIVSGSVYSNTKYKDSFVSLRNIKLKDGNEITIYELK